MSWLWGGNKGSDPPKSESFNDTVQPAMPPDDPKAEGIKEMQQYRFNSSGLEKAAKFARGIDQCGHPRETASLTVEELKKEQLAAEADFQQRVKEDELIKIETLNEGLKVKYEIDKASAEYRDQLARTRNRGSAEKHEGLKMELVKIAEDSHARIQEMKRSAFEQQLKRQAEWDLEKIEKETLARGRVERKNQDLILERVRLEGQERREKRLESIKSIGSLVGDGFNSLLGDRNKVEMVVGATVAIAAGFIFARKSITQAFNFLEARLMTPTLIKETSRITPLDTLKHPIKTVRKIQYKLQPPQDVLKGVVLKDEVEATVRDIAIETKNCRKAKTEYRNVLLHGPPGTGKTLFAKRLAMHSGMDYAILTGGDAQIMGSHVVESLHKVFRWAAASRKGLILFIDEAESFLIDRRKVVTQTQREMLATFLSCTGTSSKKFMLVLTSNLPEEFDMALMNRIHVVVEFGLPELQERIKLVAHYFQHYVLEPANSSKLRIRVSEKTPWMDLCKQVAEITEGLSGREIEHMTMDWQMKAIVSETGEFTPEMMIERAKVAVEKKVLKEKWSAEQEKKLAKRALSQAVADAAATPAPAL